MARYVVEVEGERYIVDMKVVPPRYEMMAWVAGPDDRADADAQ